MAHDVATIIPFVHSPAHTSLPSSLDTGLTGPTTMYTKISSTAKRSFHCMVEEIMALGSWCSWQKKEIAISSEHQCREPKSVNIFLGFFFLVNYSLGGGFLAIPYSFLHAGYLVAIPTLLVIVFVTWIHASWLLEVMARAQVRWGWLFL